MICISNKSRKRKAKTAIYPRKNEMTHHQFHPLRIKASDPTDPTKPLPLLTPFDLQHALDRTLRLMPDLFIKYYFR